MNRIKIPKTILGKIPQVIPYIPFIPVDYVSGFLSVSLRRIMFPPKRKLSLDNTGSSL